MIKSLFSLFCYSFLSLTFFLSSTSINAMNNESVRNEEDHYSFLRINFNSDQIEDEDVDDEVPSPPSTHMEEDPRDATYESALNLIKAEKYFTALEVLSPLAEDDYLKAQIALGYIHEFHLNNIDEAVKWYKIAADGASLSCKFSLAVMSYFDDLTDITPETVVAWLQETHNSTQCPSSVELLSRIFYYGWKTIPQDEDRASNLFPSENRVDQFVLGQKLIGEDYHLGLHFLRQSASNGYPLAIRLVKEVGGSNKFKLNYKRDRKPRLRVMSYPNLSSSNNSNLE